MSCNRISFYQLIDKSDALGGLFNLLRTKYSIYFNDVSRYQDT